MDKSCEVIDLCVKSEKSDDTSTTIPLEAKAIADASPPVIIEDETTSRRYPSKRDYTEQWICDQSAFISEPPPSNENSLVPTPQMGINGQHVAEAIPTEITELVHKECAIKLINHLVIYAFNKVTEADLHTKFLSITPDIDPQLNYRSMIGFRCVYERCVVLFYEALLDLTEILKNLSPSHQAIVILWMYDTVESLSKAHGVDSSFLRNEKYIEALLRDFSESQRAVPDPENVFYNIYQKMQPTMVAVENQPAATIAAGPPKKRGRPRKPRTQKSNEV